MSDTDKLMPSTKEHLRRMAKSVASTLPYSNYKPSYVVYDFDGDYEYNAVLLGAFLNGPCGRGFFTMNDFCIAEGLGEEYVVQFFKRPKISGYVNIALTISALPADGDRTYSTIRILLDVTLHERALHEKVMKCNGLTYDMPGFQMELLGDYDPG